MSKVKLNSTNLFILDNCHMNCICSEFLCLIVKLNGLKNTAVSTVLLFKSLEVSMCIKRELLNTYCTSIVRANYILVETLGISI